MSSPALVVETLAQFTQAPYSINEKTFRFNTTCFGGDRFICLKTQQDGGDPQVGIIDTYNDYVMDRRPTRKADGAMKNPAKEVLALKGRGDDEDNIQTIQVFDLGSKSRLGEFSLKSGDEVVYWRWVGESLLVLVTLTAVYHWVFEGAETTPDLIFQREGRMNESDVQVINYYVDAEESEDIKWCLLAGIYLDSSKTIRGCLQLYSIEKKQCQFLDGPCGCFAQVGLDESHPAAITKVFSFCEFKKDSPAKFFVLDVYSQRGAGLPSTFKATAEFTMPPEHVNDIPIAQHFSARYGLFYCITKNGLVLLFDPKTAKLISCEKFSSEGIFLCHEDKRTGGVLALSRKGSLISIRINEQGFIPQVQGQVGGAASYHELESLSRRYGYPQSDDFNKNLYRQLMTQHDVQGASRLCSLNKSHVLRTPAILNEFKEVKKSDGGSGALQYFQAILKVPGRLLGFESQELMRPVVAQGKLDLGQQWILQDRLTCTEQLGDMISEGGMGGQALALKVYERAGVHAKVLQMHIEGQNVAGLLAYCKKKNYVSTDWGFLLRTSISKMDTANYTELTKELLVNGFIDPNTVVDIYVGMSKVDQLTGIMVEALPKLEGNQATLGPVQTRILEINLATNPQAAETLFQQETFKYYDRPRVAALCEKAGLYRRALENFDNLPDIKRVMMKTGSQMNLDWLSNFCQSMSPTVCVEVLTDMLRTNRGNLNAVVQMANKYHQRLGLENLINLFESVNSLEGLYSFLGTILAFTTDAEVHFKYIETAVKLGNWAECERVVRESKHYDPVRVKDFLKSQYCPEPRALVYVCDIYGFVEELTESLYRKNKLDYLEVYVTRVNTQAAAKVAPMLLDLGCPEVKVLEILQSVRGACPIEPLIPEMEKRGRLALILPWMEGRIEEGMTDELLNNAVAKVYIETNKQPEVFLSNNVNYNPLEIGKFCEDKDPHLAVTAYIRGQCDEQLIEIVNKNGLFRLLAKYIVQREDEHVWSLVLGPNNPEEYRRLLIDQIVATGLPEATRAEEVYAAVKAFAAAGLSTDLTDLLERIVVQKTLAPNLASELSGNGQLQNLLLYTALKNNPEKTKDLILKLNNYDAVEAAQAALADDCKRYDEALLIYQKHGMNLEALEVMLKYKHDFDGAIAFSEKVRQGPIWTAAGNAFLERAEEKLNAGEKEECGKLVVTAMSLFCKGEKFTNYQRVITVAKEVNRLEELVDFLKQLRRTATADFSVDTELAHSLARTNQQQELETFLAGVNTANCQKVGDSLFNDGSKLMDDPATVEEGKQAFRYAKIFFQKIPNHTKLTACNLKLGDHTAAIEAAKRAGSAKSWTEVALAAIQSANLKVAHAAGLNVIGHSDHLEQLIEAYEERGYYEELVSLLEAGAATGKCGISLYTELGKLYAEHDAEKLMDYLKSATGASGRLNVPKLLKVCDKEHLWSAVVLLYMSYKEYDQAAQTVLTHPAVTWEHAEFVKILQQVSNQDLIYRSICFYIEQHPGLLCNLLSGIGSARMDYNRLINTCKKGGDGSQTHKSPLALIQPFLEIEQANANVSTSVVNDTLHRLYIDSKDVKSLHKSISAFDNFDQTQMAKTLEQHELLEMKHLALLLYEKNGKFSHSIDLAKKFKKYPEAIAIAYKSKSFEVAESLLHFFANELNSAQHFAACLQVCHNLIRPEIAMELAWFTGYQQEVMPYMIQTMKGLSSRITNLEKKLEEQKAERKEKSSPQDWVPNIGGMAMLPPMAFESSSVFDMPRGIM